MTKMPVHVWRRGERTVTLIGARHIGTPEYFRTMRARIFAAEAAGAVVHVEGTKKTSDPTATEQELDWIKRLSVDPQYEGIAEAVGLVSQKTLGYEDHWVNHDLTLLEILRNVPDPERFVANMEEMGDLTAELKQFPSVARILGWLIGSGVLARLRYILGRGRDLKDVHPLREKVAVDAMVQESRDVVAVWGAGHLRGMGRLLRLHGWTRVQ